MRQLQGSCAWMRPRSRDYPLFQGMVLVNISRAALSENENQLRF